jgi:ribosomal protein L40E
MPQYCYRCNTENPDTARHCSNCGQELRAAPIGSGV